MPSIPNHIKGRPRSDYLKSKLSPSKKLSSALTPWPSAIFFLSSSEGAQEFISDHVPPTAPTDETDCLHRLASCP